MVPYGYDSNCFCTGTIIIVDFLLPEETQDGKKKDDLSLQVEATQVLLSNVTG